MWDIETGNFKADIGRLICAVTFDMKHADTLEDIPDGLDLPIDVVRGDDEIPGLRILRRDFAPCRGRGAHGKTDQKLAKELKDELESFDIWISYNGKMFDVPFLNSRLLEFGYDRLDKKMHADIYYQCRRPQMILTSARLENLQRFFGTKHQKIALEPLVWRDAIEGDLEATDAVVRHCVNDVLGTAEVFPHVKDGIRNLHRG